MLFRVFDKKLKAYNKKDIFFIDSQGVLSKYSFSLVPKELRGEEDPNNYVVEFSTGHKDKNGKEIFQNDLLKIGDDIFRIIWDGAETCWRCTFVKSLSKEINLKVTYNAPTIWSYSAEIIGNINENPKIMEGVY